MALPTLQKAWQFNVNNVVHAIANLSFQVSENDKDTDAMFWLKDGLVSWALAPWTVAGSCNSVLVGMDGVDRWSGIGDVIWNTAGSAHSWIVLNAPTGPAQLCIDLGFNATRIAFLVFSPEGLFTGGSTTNRPTAPDEVGTASEEWLDGAYWTPHMVTTHLLQTLDGKTTFFAVCRGGSCQGGFLHFQVSNIEPNWETDSEGREAPYGFVFCDAGASGEAFDYYMLTDNPPLPTMQSYSKVAYTGDAGDTFKYNFCAEGSRLGTGDVDAVGRKWAGKNNISQRWPMAAMTMVSVESGALGVKGRVPDIYFGATAKATGTHYEEDPFNPTYRWVQFGDIIVPWNGTVPKITP